MKQRILFLAGLFFVLLQSALAQGQYPPPGNLIVNGDFESFFSGWQGSYGLYSDPINPAPLSGNTVGVLMDGQAGMFQSFSTVPGDTYQLEFGIRLVDLLAPGFPLEGDPSDVARVNILLNGQSFQAITFSNRDNWAVYDFDFQATDTNTQLGLVDPRTIPRQPPFTPPFSPPTYSASAFIDNVSVVQVPDKSATCGLLFVAFVLCVRIKQRLRQA